MTDEANDLIATLNSIRKDDFPDIPEALVEDIVQIEYNNMEDRNTTQDKISDKVESYLEEVN